MINGKRIHKVTIKRMVDSDPDSSWMGKYGNRAESEYAIDRVHETYCAAQDYNVPADAERILNRAMDYLQHSERESDFYVADACDTLQDAADSLHDCDCGRGGGMMRAEYQYFNPCHENYEGCDHAESVKCCLRDYERMESLCREQWCFIGIRAEAEVSLADGVLQTVTSGGLWGIESDSGDSYLREVEQEELANLRVQLTAMGFSKRAVSKAFQDVVEASE